MQTLKSAVGHCCGARLRHYRNKTPAGGDPVGAKGFNATAIYFLTHLYTSIAGTAAA
jgi:hypothetical protein